MNKLFVMLAIFLFSSSAFSQSLAVFGVDPSGFPTIKAKFFAFDATGNQITNLSNSSFDVKENGQPRTVTNVSCPLQKPPLALSSVLTIDVSGSMTGNGLSIAKEAAKAWINMLPLGKSECAVTTFSDNNNINQDFTTDRNLLFKAINSLKPTSGTDYDMGLLNTHAGSLVISKYGIRKRVVVFLTDGAPNREPQVSRIIAEANSQNCAIYSVIIGMKCPKCLRDISDSTDGLWFENIKTEDDAKKVYQQILITAESGEPCSIEWQSEVGCLAGLISAEIKLSSLNTTENCNYQSPNNSIARLEFSPKFLSFKNIAPGVKADSTLRVTALNSDFKITNIINSNPAFTINKKSFTLAKNQSIDLTVSFIPADSGYTFGLLSFESNVCPATFCASGGFSGKKPKVKTLKLTKPNGGEEFIAGNDTSITWEGITESEKVLLEYSIDNGLTWRNIINNTSGLKYIWKHVPMPVSKQCKVRVKQVGSSGTNDKAGTLQLFLGGHVGSITDASWNPDGTRVATSSEDSTAIIWDPANGDKLFTLKGHTAKVNNVCWSPYGKQVATASDDKTAIIWDPASGAMIRTLSGHTSFVTVVRWSPDGKQIATASDDKTAIIWDASTGVKIRTLSGHTKAVIDINWSPDGKRVATASDDNTAIIWDASTGVKLRTLSGHSSFINNVNWSPDGKRVATASYDNTAIIWDAASGAKLHTLSGHTNTVTFVSWSPDGKRVATASYDNTTIIWDVASGAKLYTLTGHNSYVYYVSWSPDGKRIATASGDKTSIIWDAKNGSILQTLKGYFYTINKVTWSADGSRVVASGDDRAALIWDATSGAKLQILGGHTSAVSTVSWSPDGSRVATSSYDNTAIIWDVVRGVKLSTLIGTESLYYIRDASWSPDGSRVATFTGDSSAIIWDATSGAKLFTLKGHTNSVSNLSWSPDGSKIATSSWDRSAIIWDATSGVILHKLIGHRNYLNNVSWSPDCSRVATSSGDSTAIIWDAASGIKLLTLKGHTYYLTYISWSPDGSRVATSSYDKTAIIWDAASGIMMHTLSEHTSFVNNVSWSPDGSKVATSGNDNTAIIWDAASGIKIYKINGHSSQTHYESISWSPDGSLIAIAKNNTAMILDAASGVGIYTLSGHTGTINNLNWSPDGTLIATASSDYTTRIWNVNDQKVELQEDESDNVFSIVAPKAQAIDIDMGQCLLGSVKDSLIKGFVKNIGTYKLRADSIYISGSDANAFRLVSGLPPYELAPGATNSAEFRFIPLRVGINSATINIITQSDTLRQNISGEGVQPQLQVISNLIDFGIVNLSEQKDTLQVLTITNISTAPITITDTKHNKPNDVDFTTLAGGGSFTLQPGETRKMDLRFKPSNVGRTSGMLEFHYNMIGSPAVVQLYGEGIKFTSKITTNSPICEGDDLLLYTDSIPNAQYFWYGPDGFNSNKRNPIINNAKTGQSGRYFLYLTVGATVSDTSEINVLINTSLVSPGDSSLIFVGSAAKVGDFIKLNDAKPWDGGSVWLKNRFSVKQNFTTTFKFRTRFGNNNGVDDGSLPGADGFAFVMQNHKYPVLGDKGGSIGYTGITNSLAIEFDLYKNTWDPNGNHIAYQSRYSMPNTADHRITGFDGNDLITTIKQDTIYYVKIEYDWTNSSMKIYLDETGNWESLAMPMHIWIGGLETHLNLEEGEYVYIGFTAGTGQAYQEHDIFDWTIPCKNQLVGVEENSIKYSNNTEEFTIFPNPSNDNIFISLSNRRLQPSVTESATESVDIRIFNTLGECVKKPQPSPTQGEGVRIDVSSLAPGLYYCTVSSGMNRVTKSFAVVR